MDMAVCEALSSTCVSWAPFSHARCSFFSFSFCLQTPCQQELDQVLERISTMRLPDDRGPLEHLYSLHIPNCDKHGLYNLKQVSAGQPGLRRPLLLASPNPQPRCT